MRVVHRDSAEQFMWQDFFQTNTPMMTMMTMIEVSIIRIDRGLPWRMRTADMSLMIFTRHYKQNDPRFLARDEHRWKKESYKLSDASLATRTKVFRMCHFGTESARRGVLCSCTNLRGLPLSNESTKLRFWPTATRSLYSFILSSLFRRNIWKWKSL